MKKVELNATLQGPLATLTVDMIYLNPKADNPIEVTYEFPVEKEIVLSKLIVEIEDKTVKTVVIDKQKAE